MADASEAVASMSWLPLTTRLEQAFAARVSDLPADTRLLLLVAALNDDNDAVSETLAAAAAVRGDALAVDTFGPAVEARLVETDGMRVAFRHPLIRSAVVQRSASAARSAA
jgi:hypothetical protein